MSREVRRVPVDFDWPLNKTWEGYVWPERLAEKTCPDCNGDCYAPGAQHMYEQWYGKVPFDPASTGSTPLTTDSPAVRWFAERNVSSAAWFYGSGEQAIVKEAQRLADLWNGMWMHHLSQDDVDALLAAEQLWEFTHTWIPGTGWVEPESPVAPPTVAQVNEWSLTALGGPSAGAPIRARCEREGVVELCPTCGGEGSLEAYEGQRAEIAAYKPTPPPEGEGWQLWESTTDGSPVTPVFATSDALVDHLVSVGERHTDGGRETYRRAAAEALVSRGSSIGTGFSIDGEIFDGAQDADKWPTATAATS